MNRTIVVSDVHGEPDVLARALEHSRFRHGVDRLVIAGDLVEIGSDTSGVLDRAEELDADVLVGNHELGVVIGQPIEDETVDLDCARRVLDGVLSGEWALAVAVEGVLVSHAGVSRTLQDDFEGHCSSDVAVFAAWLNNAWLADLEDAVERGSIGLDGLAGLAGPLWYRPAGPDAMLSGVVQVFGHTPPQIFEDGRAVRELERAGIHLVDPYVRGWVRDGRPYPAPFRYAVIEDGCVHVRSAAADSR